MGIQQGRTAGAAVHRLKGDTVSTTTHVIFEVSDGVLIEVGRVDSGYFSFVPTEELGAAVGHAGTFVTVPAERFSAPTTIKAVTCWEEVEAEAELADDDHSRAVAENDEQRDYAEERSNAQLLTEELP